MTEKFEYYNNSTKEKVPLFEAGDTNWYPDQWERHHEPRLKENSHELVNEAIEIKQDSVATLDESSKNRFLKAYGLGPCLLFVVHNLEGQKLGAIHFDAGSDIPDLINKLKKKLNIKDFEEFTKSLIGGIKEMEGSEALKNDFDEQDIKIDYNNSMQLAVSDYKDFLTEESVPLLCYQSVIINKETGEILSFNPFSDKIKKD